MHNYYNITLYIMSINMIEIPKSYNNIIKSEKLNQVCQLQNGEKIVDFTILDLENYITKIKINLNMTFDFHELIERVYISIESINTWETIEQAIVRESIERIVISDSYSKLAVWILVNKLHQNTHDDYMELVQEMKNNCNNGNPAPIVNDNFVAFVQKHHQAINNAFVYERDYDYSIFGFKTMERSYLKKLPCGKIIERPQHMLMRVAICIHERNDDIDLVIQSYEYMSQKYFTHATPTLFNAGSTHQQLSSCFLLSVDDSMEDIGEVWKDCAMISKEGGGISVNVCNIRSNGAYLSTTQGKAGGLKMLHVLNEIARYADQGGKRQGSIAVYIEPWHADVEYFLELKTKNGTESEKTRDLFLALSVNDIFMRRAKNNETWSLMCPNSCPKLLNKYGDDFDREYIKYEEEGNYIKKINARDLMFTIQRVIFETGVPYIVFKDNINKKSNLINVGVISSLNLCVEITLPSSSQYYSVCFTKDTQILTKTGLKNIDMCDGEDVYSEYRDDTSLIREPHYEKAVLLKNGLQPVYKLKTSGNKEISVTRNHPFLTICKKTGSYIWTPVSELKPGDKIVTPCTTTLENHNIDNHEISLGHIVAGTHISDTWNSTTEENKYNLINPPSAIYSLLGKYGITNCESFNKTIKNEIHHNNLFNKENKRVPLNIFAHNPSYRANFLATIFSLDGNVNYKKRKLHVRLTSESINFLYDIQSMLVSFGIQSKVFQSKTIEKLFKLIIFGMKPLHRFRKYIDFKLSNRKQNRLSEILKSCHMRKIKYNEYSSITHVYFSGEQIVYDLSLPVSHNYLAGSHVVHNCNLASICLPEFVEKTDGITTFNYKKLHDVTRIVTRNLNNIIDINYYPVLKTVHYNVANRPIGIGQQGLADVFGMFRTAFDSDIARELNKNIAETIYHGALTESIEIAKTKGPYGAYNGSPISEGKLQFDLWGLTTDDLSGLWDWDELRNSIKTYGVANCITTTCMPTASTSQIMGNNECIEPYTENIYVRSTSAGEFYVINRHLRLELEELGLWSEDMVDLIKYLNGSIARINNIPDDIKYRYRTVWELPQKSIIDMSADRGAFIDNSQSLNIFIKKPDYKILNSCLYRAWSIGLKTGLYYLRTDPENTAAKFGIDEYKKKHFDQILLPVKVDHTNNYISIPSSKICKRRPKNLSNLSDCEMCHG